jgi:hypothetical protein
MKWVCIPREPLGILFCPWGGIFGVSLARSYR